MGLVTAKEVAKAINTDKYGVLGTFSGWLLMKVLKISTLNKIYNRNNKNRCYFYSIKSNRIGYPHFY